MARTNANWRQQPTASARLAALDLYTAELEAEVQPNVGKGGSTRSSEPILELLRQLRAERPAVAQAATVETQGSIRRLYFA